MAEELGKGEVSDPRADGGGCSRMPQAVGDDLFAGLVGDQTETNAKPAKATADGVHGPRAAVGVSENLFRRRPAGSPQANQEPAEAFRNGDAAGAAAIAALTDRLKVCQKEKALAAGELGRCPIAIAGGADLSPLKPSRFAWSAEGFFDAKQQAAEMPPGSSAKLHTFKPNKDAPALSIGRPGHSFERIVRDQAGLKVCPTAQTLQRGTRMRFRAPNLDHCRREFFQDDRPEMLGGSPQLQSVFVRR
jgi:hypothetical protein